MKKRITIQQPTEENRINKRNTRTNMNKDGLPNAEERGSGNQQNYVWTKRQQAIH